MGGKFETKVKVNIRANINAVWRGLTDPALIKQYFFGTNAVSDWKKVVMSQPVCPVPQSLRRPKALSS